MLPPEYLPYIDAPILSVRQPWAWSIFNLGKDIENRPRRFHHRGPLLIHASSTLIAKEVEEWRCTCREIRCQGWREYRPESAELGGIIGVVSVTGCVEASASPWFFGTFGLVLADAKRLPFLPMKGRLGLFKLPKQ